MIASTQTNHPLHGNATAADSQSRLDAACVRLHETGLRITQPRIAIISALLAREKPMSIEQIHADLDANSCDLVTVYRCLGAFEEIGLVRRSFYHNGTSLYQLSDRDSKVYHVVDKGSKEITELDTQTSTRLSTLLREVEDQLRASGYENVSHVLEFFVKSSKSTKVRARIGQPKVKIVTEA